jgi:hypothetical protein
MTVNLGQRQSDLEIAYKKLDAEFRQNETSMRSLLSHEPASTASWIPAFGIVKKNLERSLSNMKTVISDSWKSVEAAKREMNAFKSKAEPRSVETFATVYKMIADSKNKIETDVAPETTLVIRRIGYLANWYIIADLYKAAFDKVNRIEQTVGDASLLTDFDTVSNQLKDFLTDEKEEGLKDHEAKKRQIDDINKKAETKMNEFRGAFITFKLRLSESLKTAKGVDVMIRTSFDDSNVKGSYVSLGEEVREQFVAVSADLSDQLGGLRTETKYSVQILGQQRGSEIQDIENRISEAELELKKKTDQISSEILSDPDSLDVILDAANSMKTIREHLGESRVKIRRLQGPKSVSSDAKVMLTMLERVPQRNLKDVILEMSGEEELDLDRVLNILKECFKANQIEIVVKRKQ